VRLVAFGHFVFLVVADVAVELAEVFVLEGIVFQFDQHVALEDAMVEDEIDEEVFAADQQAFLPGFEAEAVAEFEQEVLQPVEQRVFALAFAHHFARLEAEELEDVGVADEVAAAGRFGTGLGQPGQRGFVGG